MYRKFHRYPRRRRFMYPGYRRPWGRRFLTKEEKEELKERYKENRIKRVERYKEFLEKELAGVNEWLEEQKKKKEE